MILRRILFVVKLLLLLLGLLLVGSGAYLWFDGNNLLTRLTPRIETELGRNFKAKVVISDLKLKLFPRFGLTMNAISLKPDNSCGTISAQRGSLYIDFLALLRGKYIINYISLISARADISVLNGKISMVGAIGGPDSDCIKPAQDDIPIPTAAASQSTPIALNLKKLEIEGLRLSILGTKAHTLIISHLSGGALLENGNLELKSPQLMATYDMIPISLAADSTLINLNALTLALEGGSINVAEQIVQLSGKIEPGPKFQDVKVTANDFHLPKLVPLLKSFESNAREFKSGTATISATLNSSDLTGLEATGDVKLVDINIVPLQLKFAELDLQSVSYKRLPSGASQASAITSLKQFSIVDGKDSYVAGKADGPVNFTQDINGGSFQGQVALTAFGFRDGLTELRNVSARLLDINCKISKKGDVKVTTNLVGNSVELIHPSIQIKQVASVSAPLKIEIASGGKYSISGLVTAKGGNISLSGRELSQVSINVQTLISSATKKFEARQLSTTLLGRALSSSGTFTMSPDSYLFKGFQTSLRSGKITIDGKIHRDKARAFTANLTIKDVPINDIISLAKGAEDDPMDGTISSFKSSVTGSMAAPLESLNGNGSLQLVGTKVKGVDLTRSVGSALSAIPFASIKLSPDSLTDDGRTKTAQAEFSIADQIVTFSKATIYRPKYTIQASGTMSFELNLDIKAAVIFAQETLKTLGGGFHSLGALMGKIGKVEIPIFIKGTIPDISITPDLVTLARDNSGITLVGNVIGQTVKAILSPFSSDKKKSDRETPVASPIMPN